MRRRSAIWIGCWRQRNRAADPAELARHYKGLVHRGCRRAELAPLLLLGLCFFAAGVEPQILPSKLGTTKATYTAAVVERS
jgi:hypothetical protein